MYTRVCANTGHNHVQVIEPTDPLVETRKRVDEMQKDVNDVAEVIGYLEEKNRFAVASNNIIEISNNVSMTYQTAYSNS